MRHAKISRAFAIVAHDPDAFIRGEDAKLLEPLPEERPQAPKKTEAPKEPEANQDLNGLMFLPKAEFITYSASADGNLHSEFPSANRRRCLFATEAS